MRKISAVVLVLTMVVLFSACGGDKDDTTTLDPLYTAYYPSVTSSQNTAQTQSGNANGVTYVLTTNQSKTVPALNTTRFSVDNAATTASQGAATTTANYNDVSYNTTSGTITVPVVSTTRTVSTTWSTLPPTTTTTTPSTTTTLPRVTTTKPTTEPTTKAEPQAVYAVVNEVGIDSQGRVYAAIDSAGWGGKIKSNSQRVSVYVDGVEMEERAMLQISSSTTGDGYQYVYLNLAEYEIDPSSSTITFVIPEGFLENKTGTKYNYDCEVSM